MNEIENKMFKKLQSEHLDFELTRVKYVHSIIDLDAYERHQERFFGVKSAARVILKADQIAAACNMELKLSK